MNQVVVTLKTSSFETTTTYIYIYTPAAAAAVVVGCLRQRPHSSADRDFKTTEISLTETS